MASESTNASCVEDIISAFCDVSCESWFGVTLVHQTKLDSDFCHVYIRPQPCEPALHVHFLKSPRYKYPYLHISEAGVALVARDVRGIVEQWVLLVFSNCRFNSVSEMLSTVMLSQPGKSKSVSVLDTMKMLVLGGTRDAVVNICMRRKAPVLNHGS